MKTKYPREACLAVAEELSEHLSPVTTRLLTAGSVRREKPFCSDVELVYVPKVKTMPDGFFDSQTVDLTEQVFDGLLSSGILSKRPSVIGRTAWGPKNKLAIHAASGIPVDFFSTSDSHWWVSVVIRTGPAEHNIALITAAARRGLKLHAYGGHGFTTPNGNPVPVNSEQQVFELCGVPWTEPQGRGP